MFGGKSFNEKVVEGKGRAYDGDMAVLKRERDAAIAELCRWRSAFQSVTPGGSEFMSPESVIAYMQNLKLETVEAKKELARLRNQRD